jgi:TonB family protein
MRTKLHQHVLVLLAVVMLCRPAFADIKAFNAAVAKGDFKAAATAAADTWPTLDKARPDIDTIAREFGFASFMAADYGAAQRFAQAAADKLAEPGASSEFLEQTYVLLRMTQHQAAPSDLTRDRLFEALKARLAKSGFDYISLRGADALVTYDMNQGRWENGLSDGALATAIADRGGSPVVLARRGFQLAAAIAAWMLRPTDTSYQAFFTLQGALLSDMSVAPSDDEAKAFAPLFWTTEAWNVMLGNQLALRGRKITRQPTRYFDGAGAARITNTVGSLGEEPCKRMLTIRPLPEYPPSALYKGFAGTVVLQIDIDEQGRAANPRLLASVPEQYFGDVALKSIPSMKFTPGSRWDPKRCTLAKSRQVVRYSFVPR